MARIDNIWFTVINGFAASKKAGMLWEKAEKLLKDNGFEYHGTRTGRGGNATELTFDACMAGYRRFIAVGGDGTAHDVLNGIALFVEWKQSSGSNVTFSDFTLSVIPLGSGNDWIKSLGMKLDVKSAVDALMKGNFCRQDLVKVSVLDPDRNGDDNVISVSYMLNIGGVGIDAKVCERVNAKKRAGKGGRLLYVASLLHALAERRPSSVKVLCDGEEVFSGRYLSIALGIGKYSGGGMRQTPAAVLDDGLLDMTLIPDISLFRIVCEAFRLFTGTFLKIPELTVCRGRSITVLACDPSVSEPVEADGEVVGRAPVRFDVLHDQINVVSSVMR